MIGNTDGVNNDYLQGWAVDEADPSRRVPISVYYNGTLLRETVAGFPRPDLKRAEIGDGFNGFFVALPLLEHPEDAEVTVCLTETGETLGEPRSLARRPRCSRTGLLASEMLALHSTPLHSLQGLAFDGEFLRISGLHLPPGGDPFALTLHGQDGVAFNFTYPINSPGAAEWYWYWPNSAWSSFQIDIDLAASSHDGDFFEFWFESNHPDSDQAALTNHKRNYLRIPKDLKTFQRFPTGDHLTRVHRFDSIKRVAMAGFNDYSHFVDLAKAYDVDLASANVLDWGCGHGRVIRHFAEQNRVAEAWGVDIDPENIAWMQQNLPHINGEVVPLMPPTQLPADHFDLIYAISVMTHLTYEVQQAWLAELARITKPGGIVMLTFAGNTSVSFASRFLQQEWVDSWRASGFDATLDSVDLNGKIGDDEYYRNTKQTPEFTRQFWGEYFEVLGIHECMFGYQDLAVLRAR